MPIRQTTIVDIREQIARMALSGVYSISEIARHFDVSRPTVYGYRDRYARDGRDGLYDQSRAPRRVRRTEDWIVERIIADRRLYEWSLASSVDDRGSPAP
jgi:transposase